MSETTNWALDLALKTGLDMTLGDETWGIHSLIYREYESTNWAHDELQGAIAEFSKIGIWNFELWNAAKSDFLQMDWPWKSMQMDSS